MTWYTKPVEEVIKELNTSEDGLTSKEAKLRLKKHGKNIITETHKIRPFKILLDEINSFLIYVLLFAAVFSFVIGHYVDAGVILTIVILNSVIGFFQQYKAEKAIMGLRKLLVPVSKVIRNQKYSQIPSSNLVPGDIVVYNSGDKVNADSRIFECENLDANEAVLTGESLPVTKNTAKIKTKTILAERKNMLYTGTQIVKGSAKAIVVSTGMGTEFGKIASKLQQIENQKTPMQKRLDIFSKQLGFIILGLVAIIFILGMLQNSDIIEMLMVSVTLAVGAIPEGLPAVLAIAFAISSKAMSKKNVIIRKLPAVESLGSVTVICTDKTGTITEEKMNVQEIFCDNKIYKKEKESLTFDNRKVDYTKNLPLNFLLKSALLCNNSRYEIVGNQYKFIGDPTEETLVRLGLDLKLYKKQLTKNEPKIKEFEFNSKRKMMSIFRSSGKVHTLYSKGAVEKILNLSDFELVGKIKKKLTSTRKKQILNEAKKLEEKALRVLAFSYREFDKTKKPEEKELIFLGLIGMIDPPRPEVKDAISECKSAGIKIKIITGDSLLTAKAIAKQVGITGTSITGRELEKMSDSSLSKNISEIVIFARTTPQQKLRIAKTLQKNGEVVAMTGDGINDVLALKSADIGISMGKRGTDVARDISDVVLIDDNFASIVGGVREGRKTYDNIKKFTKYMLSVNLSEILIILFAMFLGFTFGGKWILPFLPLQILWVNLITDSIPAISLAFEKEEKVMKSQPRSEKSIFSDIWKFILIGGLLTFLGTFIVYFIGIEDSYPPELIRTMSLTTLVLFELSFVYVCRSNGPIIDIGIFSNKWLNYSIILGIGIHLILLYTPIGVLFNVVPLSLSNWLLILPFGLSGLILFEAYKLAKKKFF